MSWPQKINKPPGGSLEELKLRDITESQRIKLFRFRKKRVKILEFPLSESIKIYFPQGVLWKFLANILKIQNWFRKFGRCETFWSIFWKFKIDSVNLAQNGLNFESLDFCRISTVISLNFNCGVLIGPYSAVGLVILLGKSRDPGLLLFCRYKFLPALLQFSVQSSHVWFLS